MKNKKETLWYKVVITVLLILIVILANLLIDRDIPFSMRFSHEKYGTVDSWVMILITLFTGVAVFLTLNSQMKVQDAQTVIKDIEVKKYRSSIAPKLNYEESSTFDNEDNLHRLLLKISFLNNPSKRTKIITTLPIQVSLSNSSILIKQHSEEDGIYTYHINEAITNPITMDVVVFLDSSYNKLYNPYIINLVFEDDDGNLISQNIKIILEFFNTFKAHHDSHHYLIGETF